MTTEENVKLVQSELGEYTNEQTVDLQVQQKIQSLAFFLIKLLHVALPFQLRSNVQTILHSSPFRTWDTKQSAQTPA